MHVLSRSFLASTLSWWWSLPSCFCAKLCISLDTTSTCKSLWRSLFLMYQGALTMCLSTLFWNRCIMSILLCLVQPQSNWRQWNETNGNKMQTFNSVNVCTKASTAQFFATLSTTKVRTKMCGEWVGGLYMPSSQHECLCYRTRNTSTLEQTAEPNMDFREQD